MCSFPHFSPTCFDILSWNFAQDFILMHYRLSSNVVNYVNFWRSYASWWTQNIGNVQFSALFSYMLWHMLWHNELKFCIWLCFTELQIKFKYHQFASIFCSSYAPFGTWNTGNAQFCTLSLNILWHIVLKFCIWLLFNELQISLSVINFRRQFLLELCPF